MLGFAPPLPSTSGTPDDWEAWARQEAERINAQADQDLQDESEETGSRN